MPHRGHAGGGAIRIILVALNKSPEVQVIEIMEAAKGTGVAGVRP